ncbi:hypothetical protein BC830DRAFT_1086374 [Chytriomyces sp. MP71]|nr:hypothetical protein BC830DRAFT_1086374 [Chytriomyces sp. MP71]
MTQMETLQKVTPPVITYTPLLLAIEADKVKQEMPSAELLKTLRELAKQEVLKTMDTTPVKLVKGKKCQMNDDPPTIGTGKFCCITKLSRTTTLSATFSKRVPRKSNPQSPMLNHPKAKAKRLKEAKPRTILPAKAVAKDVLPVWNHRSAR